MKKPRNILFLQVDQLMTNVLSCYGETGANRPATFTRTPGIDEIASRGRIFMNSYCAGPQCVPSRTSWFTSRTVAETGVLRNEFVMEPDFPNLGSWVRDQADYLTVYAGKWHVSKLKVEDGFEVLDPGTQFGEGKDAGVGRSVMRETVLSLGGTTESARLLFLLSDLWQIRTERTRGFGRSVY